MPGGFSGNAVYVRRFNSMNVNDGALRKRILIPLAGYFIIFLAASASSLLYLQQKLMDQQMLERRETVDRLLATVLDQQVDAIEPLIENVMMQTDLQAAWTGRDREALLERARPLFGQFKTRHEITHFYFIDPDRLCFLRVHDPGRHGDTINRFTAIEAQRVGKLAAGVELGPLGTLTLRVVAPWYVDQRIVG